MLGSVRSVERLDDFGGRRQGSDAATLMRHFGTAEAVPLWIAEPDLDLLPELSEAMSSRATDGWFGYETRPEGVVGAFWEWASARHGWEPDGLDTLISPSVGTSIGMVIEALTEPGDGVIIQPPVFTDFKPLVVNAGRRAVRNALTSDDGRYGLDLDGLAALAADPTTRLLILCNPHNPVGRVWTAAELRAVATICDEHDVFVLADEVHADLALAPHRFVPFGSVAADTAVRWAATHGPIKTFGLAGVCDTLLVTADDELAGRFGARSTQLHLTRNNAFGMLAFEVAYRLGASWLESMLDTVAGNLALLRAGLPGGVSLVEPEGTYLAWLDLRSLGIPVPELGAWFAQQAGVAVSPGHWFGREGAGFARLTVAARPPVIEQALDGITTAVAAR